MNHFLYLLALLAPMVSYLLVTGHCLVIKLQNPTPTDSRVIMSPVVDTVVHTVFDPQSLVTTYHGLMVLRSMIKQWGVIAPGALLAPFMGSYLKDRRRRSIEDQLRPEGINKDQVLEQLTNSLRSYHYVF